ncbi:hypothetical protein A2331_01490 [Candidatus Falkowbacteria bacterium RIFOXYB2_FULL_34_18]|uniref:Glycosyl transferase family 1 domain-containing protein n=1 Tax=Candidatus Falkowbacteria bacterium RIFOXYD2_FULL_34_120 TaxID=1798007 RepID=A0A1F5TPL4_9BACT|nr:MAG: hypothetical protein A2331_01490 [Candidatus Falkowbacteria bacterium RIFOXYB2_FULL_34_18]OGF29289.1 MAG: hypothetical protein A2500_05370 [Candidatus Falkowbacteria bacterium RIFOXYC12_FULL_34_55]OGF36405.1 MAG: hypothetical protein A2466_01030 [Candidatus Falkowbacteria bacterium RIFOXYC2_FULL_34_220]OGF38884.1 MAG: hypothetical protein A2515_05790 [Candidatus Falkowbacteria bacterium RIFOXYD12_FULL_34_57]OGF40903.1 MAG: hypothetical protein A2531_04015 [Candidatus Falkowbacteria bact
MVIGIDASRANRHHKSGVEWYAYYLIRWFAKLDSKNKYILYTDQPLRGGLLDLTGEQYMADESCCEKTEYDKKGYQIIKSPHNNFKAKILKWPFSCFWTQGRMSLEMIFNRPDVLFVPSHTLPIIHPKRSIVTIHDVGFEKECHLYEGQKIGPEGNSKEKVLNFFVKLFTLGKYGANTIDYLRWSTEYALKHAYKIITVSNFSRKDLMDLYKADSEKIKVIYNGYNKTLYKNINDQKQVENILSKYGITQPYLFYVGRIEKKKNIPRLIEAFYVLKEKNKNIKEKLVLAGNAGNGYDEIKYQIQEFDLNNDVIMSGWLIEEDMPYLYNAASAFVFPSNYEGFGIPLLQSMACGTPIAASNTTSIPEIAREAALFFNPHNIKSMADSLEKIIIDKNLREDLIAKGYRNVEKFSWEKCAQETLKMILD